MVKKIIKQDDFFLKDKKACVFLISRKYFVPQRNG